MKTKQTFGRLKILSVNRPFARVRCKCGKVRRVRLAFLKNGHTRSCGCLAREKAKRQIGLNRPAVNPRFKHGGTSDPKLIPLYAVYRGMLRRCYCPNATGFKNWGGRGIKVCRRWRGPDGFEHWLKDMGPRPRGFWLERVNNDGNYTPKNCRWAHPKTQRANQRRMKTS